MIEFGGLYFPFSGLYFLLDAIATLVLHTLCFLVFRSLQRVFSMSVNEFSSSIYVIDYFFNVYWLHFDYGSSRYVF